jgi:potassium-transporting ATPase potassium-binding subunit
LTRDIFYVQLLTICDLISPETGNELGTDSGGFFKATRPIPFENPISFFNFLEILQLLLNPVRLSYTFGIMAENVQ